jgi:hypothetical protein
VSTKRWFTLPVNEPGIPLPKLRDGDSYDVVDSCENERRAEWCFGSYGGFFHDGDGAQVDVIRVLAEVDFSPCKAAQQEVV